MRALLEATGLTAFYGDFQALYGIDFDIGEGEIVAIIGANGAGKSTFLRALVGLTQIGGGTLRFRGETLAGLKPHVIVRRGITLVPEGRRLFPSLTVEENLRIGGGAAVEHGTWTLDRVYALFPVLRERRNSPATALSGGQQQMAAIGRALMGNPRLLLCDELSLGLAPTVIKNIYTTLADIRSQGTAIIVVEQDIVQAMRAASRVYCFQEGRVSLAGLSRDLTREQISHAYFGLR